MATAHNLFQNNCAQCHGSDGGGARGFPNLANDDWQWGGDPDTIVQTIASGRMAAMPPWGEVLGEQGVDTGRRLRAEAERPAGRRGAGRGGRDACSRPSASACHGMDGKGMTAVGAPEPDRRRLAVRRRRGHAQARPSSRAARARCRRSAERLGEQRVRLLAAYVLQLSERRRSEAAHVGCSADEYTGTLRWPRLRQDVAIVAWPSFLVASVATMSASRSSTRCWSATTTTRRPPSPRACGLRHRLLLLLADLGRCPAC